MKRVLFITAVAMTLLVSCKETKKEETSPAVQKNTPKDNNAEMIRIQDSIQLARKKTMDSLEQVKSHGHAH
ncbi:MULTISPECIES: hypothetical protein [Flavobacteriaceae]|uniref:Uncharacterized protein n=2 Tax=Flavobacteriaceae TaxID=49546 RepID=A0A223V9Q1_9FLAO|nr:MULTISPECIES: hypothetical protein [Flavobacteriaceae]ASV31589.1 hypothetical protein CJ263_15965 [Maribacter cobaltidurans]MCL6219295.1 hypothetical protein [Zunongwangia pacifica]GGD96057.1 hypothetical protein GCM10011412_37740 [Maribacter cobaltidurans]